MKEERHSRDTAGWNGWRREGPALKVVLADDHAMVLEGLASLLKEAEGLEVSGQALDGAEALDLIRSGKPDVAVLDYTMPVIDGVSAAEQIRSRFPKVKVLILTMHENIHYAVKAMEAGAHGFVLKSAAAKDLVRGIRAVCAGKLYISPSVLERMTDNLVNRRKKSGLDALTRREFELLRLLGAGRRLQDCAEAMSVSESTVSTYRARLMEKLMLTSTAEIIRFALENGIAG